MIDESKGFTLVREIDATPEELWEAWTNPDEAAAWWHPRGLSTPRDSVTIDARVGGSYAYTMVNDATGERYLTVGVYREVSPHRRLVFTWGSPDAALDDAALITVTIERRDELSIMTLDVRGFAAEPGDGNFYDGWESALDVFVDHVQGAERIR